MSDDDEIPSAEDGWPPAIAESNGVTVIWASGSSPADLTQRIAVILGEHLEADHDMHVSTSVAQSGWHTDSGHQGNLLRPGRAPYTTLQFTHTAIIILRRRAPTP